MIKSILVAMDGSDHSWSAWHYALDIAKALKARLRILSVVDTSVPELSPAAASVHSYRGVPVVSYFPSGFSAGSMETSSAEAETELLAKHREMLEHAERNSQAAEVVTQTQLASGRPAATIVSFDSVVDLIAIGHRSGLGVWDKFVMGSVAEEVVRQSRRPVLVAPRTYAPIERLLVAYDGSEPALRALHLAAELSTTLKLPLLVTHIDNHGSGWTYLRQAREYLASYQLRNVQFVRSAGDVSEQIVKTAKERGANLIVMGAQAHSRLHEALLGSATAGVLHKMDLPLLMTS